MFCLLANTPGGTMKISMRRIDQGRGNRGSLENRREIQSGWCHDDRLGGIYALRAQPFLNPVFCLCILVQVVQS
jgi:hypothetical protein